MSMMTMNSDPQVQPKLNAPVTDYSFLVHPYRPDEPVSQHSNLQAVLSGKDHATFQFNADRLLTKKV